MNNAATAGSSGARETLLRSAAELFARSGFDGVSIREINRHAKLSPAAAHYHFKSKEALRDEVLDKGLAVVQPMLIDRLDTLKIRSSATSAELVRAVGESYIELLQAEPDFGRWWLQIAAHLSDSELLAVNSGIEPLMVTLIERTFPRVPLRERRFLWRMAVMTLIARLTEIFLDTDDPSLRAAHAQLLIDFATAGLEASMDAAQTPSKRGARGPDAPIDVT